MFYLADLLLIQLLALCSVGGLAPRAATEKRQRYSKSNNPKQEQKAELQSRTKNSSIGQTKPVLVFQTTCCVLLH